MGNYLSVSKRSEQKGAASDTGDKVRMKIKVKIM